MKTNESERAYYTTIIAKVQANCSPLSNEELSDAINFYSKLEYDISLMGMKYNLMWKNVFYTLDTLKSYKRARD